MELADHGLKPLKLWAKINLCSSKLFLSGSLVTAMRSWLTHSKTPNFLHKRNSQEKKGESNKERQKAPSLHPPFKWMSRDQEPIILTNIPHPNYLIGRIYRFAMIWSLCAPNQKYCCISVWAFTDHNGKGMLQSHVMSVGTPQRKGLFMPTW